MGGTMLHKRTGGSRADLLAGSFLAFSILLVIIAGFSIGLAYLELEPGLAIPVQRWSILAGAIALLVSATALNLFMRRRPVSRGPA
jgi:hypothetical protein